MQREAVANRHCDFYKAQDQLWYMNYAPFTGGNFKSSDCFGPFKTFQVAFAYLKAHLPNPGGWAKDASGKKPIPRRAPNGHPVKHPEELVTPIPEAKLAGSTGRVLNKQASDIDVLFPEIAKAMASVQTYNTELRILADTLKVLIQAAESRRLGRISDIRVNHIRFDGKQITSEVTGTTGVYDTRITVLPSRGHHCTCPDWMQNGRRVGPCKHVLALGTAFRDLRLVPAIDRVSSALENILEHSEV